MNIRQLLAELGAGDPPVVVAERHQVNYVRMLAWQNGQRLAQEKLPDGIYELRCIGWRQEPVKQFLARLRRCRRLGRRWREKYPEKYREMEERRALNRKLRSAATSSWEIEH